MSGSQPVKVKPNDRRKSVLRSSLFSRNHTFEFIAPISMRRCLERLDWLSRWGFTLDETNLPSIEQHSLDTSSHEFRLIRKNNSGSRESEIVGVLSSLDEEHTLVSGTARSMFSAELYFLVLAIFIFLVFLSPFSIPLLVIIWLVFDLPLASRHAVKIIRILEDHLQ